MSKAGVSVAAATLCSWGWTIQGHAAVASLAMPPTIAVAVAKAAATRRARRAAAEGLTDCMGLTSLRFE